MEFKTHSTIKIFHLIQPFFMMIFLPACSRTKFSLWSIFYKLITTIRTFYSVSYFCFLCHTPLSFFFATKLFIIFYSTNFLREKLIALCTFFSNSSRINLKFYFNKHYITYYYSISLPFAISNAFMTTSIDATLSKHSIIFLSSAIGSLS